MSEFYNGSSLSCVIFLAVISHRSWLLSTLMSLRAVAHSRTACLTVCNYLECFSASHLMGCNEDPGAVASLRGCRPLAICLLNDKVRTLQPAFGLARYFLFYSLSLPQPFFHSFFSLCLCLTLPIYLVHVLYFSFTSFSLYFVSFPGFKDTVPFKPLVSRTSSEYQSESVFRLRNLIS
jgi:hypothetical protein